MNHGRSNQDQDARYQNAARLYGAAIERLARGYEADAELRRDLVQEIHTALWRSYSYFEGQCSERSWVYRIAHNVAVSHLIARRRLKRESLAGLDEIEMVSAGGDLEHEMAGKRIVERLLVTIHRLAPADRQVMLLYLEDLTAAQSTWRARLYRGSSGSKAACPLPSGSHLVTCALGSKDTLTSEVSYSYEPGNSHP